MQIRRKNCWSISCVNGYLQQINLFVRSERSPKTVMNRSEGDVNKLIMFYVAAKGFTGDCKWKTLESFALIMKACAELLISRKQSLKLFREICQAKL